MELIIHSLSKKTFSKINLIKITVITFSALYLIGNFAPFYNGYDSLVYGLTAIELSQGTYAMSNELLTQSGKWEFVPHQWVKTVDNTYVPKSNPGFPVIASIAYIIGGEYALFYLGPIFTILLLIVSERISTKLFDERVGLLTLLLLVTNFMIFTVGIGLVTDSLFALFTIFGTYYLIKFYKNSKYKNILLASIIFSISGFFRIIGIVFFPFELIIIIGFITFHFLKHEKNKEKPQQKKVILKYFFMNFFKKRNLLIYLMLILPWIAFFSIGLSYNNYYFGNPLTSYGSVVPHPALLSDFESGKNFLLEDNILEDLSFLNIDDRSSRDFGEIDLRYGNRIWQITDRLDVVRGYFLYLLPSQFPWAQTLLENNEESYGKDFLGILPLLIIPPALFFSLKKKDHRMEIITLLLIIIFIIGIYSITSVPDGIVGRYTIPTIPIFSILLAYVIMKIYDVNPNTFFKKRIKLFKNVKIIFRVVLVLYFIFAFYISDPFQWGILQNFEFKNPENFDNRYPLDKEGISENAILVNHYGSRALEYELIPFNGYIGNYEIVFTPEGFSQGSIQLLKSAMNIGYDAYVLKTPKHPHDKSYFEFMLTKNLVLKDYSNTFCQIKIGSNMTGIITPEPDKICYEKFELERKTKWYDQLFN